MVLHSKNSQTAIYSKLNDDSTLDGIVGNYKIFDDVPQGTSYPYVVIGEETAIDAGAKDTDAQEFTLTIHIWSRYKGRKQTKEIAERIYTILHNVAISVTGASLVQIRHEFERTLLENDGITRHGVMRFRAVVFDN